MNLLTILKALPTVGPLIQGGCAVAELINEAIATLNPADQATAKAALADLQAENDEGHVRYQAKLAAAVRA